jgi:hypothetical protein
MHGEYNVKIRMNVKEIWWRNVHEINLAQDRDQRKTFVNTVMNILLTKRREIWLMYSY